MGIFDTFLLRRQQLLEIIAWIKSWSVILRDYKQNLGVIVGYTKNRTFRILSSPTAIFPCPACCVKWHTSHRRKASGVLGSPTDLLLAHGQARHGGGHISNNIGAVRISAYIQKEKEVDSKRTDFKACADEKTAVYCRT